MRRTLTTLAITVGLLFAFTPAASAGNLLEEHARCTAPMSGSGQTTRICMRLWYKDLGSAVILKRVEWYETQPRTLEPDGYKVQNAWVKCGTVSWFGTFSAWGDEGQVIGYNPDNIYCPEGQVTFGGVGVLVAVAWPDPSDQFGNPPNGIPVD